MSKQVHIGVKHKYHTCTATALRKKELTGVWLGSGKLNSRDFQEMHSKHT